MSTLLTDLFKGLGNTNWELARILGTWAVFSYSGAFIASATATVIRGSEQPDFSAIGVGFAAVLAGAGALIFAKDSARTNAVSQHTQDETAKDPPPPKAPVGVSRVKVVNPPSQPVPVEPGATLGEPGEENK